MTDKETDSKPEAKRGFLSTPERRDSRREPIATVYVAIRESPDDEDPRWAGSAVDLNATGMALVLPPELPSNSRVYLSFRLGSDEYSRVPGTVVRHDVVGVGAVHFVDWSEEDKLALITYLQQAGSPP